MTLSDNLMGRGPKASKAMKWLMHEKDLAKQEAYRPFTLLHYKDVSARLFDSTFSGCLREVPLSATIPLHFGMLHDPAAGINQYLVASSRNLDDTEGLVICSRNMKVAAHSSIHPTLPAAFLTFSADVVIFAPKVGDTILAKVFSIRLFKARCTTLDLYPVMMNILKEDGTRDKEQVEPGDLVLVKLTSVQFIQGETRAFHMVGQFASLWKRPNVASSVIHDDLVQRRIAGQMDRPDYQVESFAKARKHLAKLEATGDVLEPEFVGGNLNIDSETERPPKKVKTPHENSSRSPEKRKHKVKLEKVDSAGANTSQADTNNNASPDVASPKKKKRKVKSEAD